MDSRPLLLLRALSLFGPGELRALRVIDPRCFELIAAELDRLDSSAAVRLELALSSLRAVSWSGYGRVVPAYDFVERHGAALTEVDGNYWMHLDAADRALASCTRLESLTNVPWAVATRGRWAVAVKG
jgi:hypothetical protein